MDQPQGSDPNSNPDLFEHNPAIMSEKFRNEIRGSIRVKADDEGDKF